MSTIPMPEPVAAVIGGILRQRRGADLEEGDTLITTTQAEAYKDACVREALEKAESVVRRNADACSSLAVKVMLHSNADAIRALLPPLPGPVEPTT